MKRFLFIFIFLLFFIVTTDVYADTYRYYYTGSESDPTCQDCYLDPVCDIGPSGPGIYGGFSYEYYCKTFYYNNGNSYFYYYNCVSTTSPGGIYTFAPVPGESGADTLPDCLSTEIRSCYDAGGNKVYFEILDCNGVVHAYGDFSQVVGDCLYYPGGTGYQYNSPSDVDAAITEPNTGWEIPKVEPEPSPWYPQGDPATIPWEAPSEINDFDGDGIVDAFDSDLDGDGIVNYDDNDNDNDGIDDQYDITPYCSVNPDWRVDKTYYNGGYTPGAEPDGGLLQIQGGDYPASATSDDFVRGTDGGWYMKFGDTSGDELSWLDIAPDGSGSVFRSKGSIQSVCGVGFSSIDGEGEPGGDVVGGPENDIIYNNYGAGQRSTYSDRSVGEDLSDIPDAVGNEGNVSDLDYLSDLVANSQGNTIGLQNISEFLSAIEQDQKTFGKGMLGILEGIRQQGSGSGFGSAEDVGNAVESSQSVAGNSEATSQNAILDGQGSGVYDPYLDADIPDTSGAQTDYETQVSTVIDTGDLATVTGQVGVGVSAPVSSVSCEVFGAIIDFDFGKYDSIYALIGTAWLSLCYLFGFFIIVRG